jgi:hypothetical protein
MMLATINANNNTKTMTSTCSTTTMMNIKNKTTKKIDNTTSTTQVTSKGLKTLVAKNQKHFPHNQTKRTTKAQQEQKVRMFNKK